MLRKEVREKFLNSGRIRVQKMPFVGLFKGSYWVIYAFLNPSGQLSPNKSPARTLLSPWQVTAICHATEIVMGRDNPGSKRIIGRNHQINNDPCYRYI